MYASIRQAHEVATQNVPWQEVLYGEPAGNWLRGRQAIVHSHIVIAGWGLVAVPACALMVILWGFTRDLFPCLWRTVKLLERALDEPTVESGKSGGLVQDRCPPPRGKNWLAGVAPAPPKGNPLLSAERRRKLYKAAKANNWLMRRVGFLMFYPLLFVLGEVAFGPVYVTWQAGFPLLEGYRLAFFGYSVGQQYSVARIAITDAALGCTVILPYFALMFMIPWQMLRLRRRFEPQVVAAMHVLDVMLWRRAQRKGA
jgi:hypothetical protein